MYDNGGTLTLTNSIVAGNTENVSGQAGNDCYGCGTQSGANIISTTATPITAAQLMLGPLAYNGANQAVQTLLPLPGSPAIEAGNPALLPVGMTTDERGLHRTINGKLDLGAVQTNYTAVQFMQQPANTAVNTRMTPPVTLSVTESGAAALNIPVPLTLTGNGTLGGTTTETTLASVGIAVATASYGNLSVNTAGTGDTLDVTLPIVPSGGTRTPLTLTATSSAFDIFQTAPTITWSPTPPTSVVYGAAPISLNATLNATGPTISYVVDAGPATISGNKLTFTGAGTVIVEAVSTATNNYASGNAVAYITVTPATTTTTLAVSPTTPITAGSSVTLTATVKSGSAAVPSGLVIFSSGTTSIGVASLSASGVAILNTTLLPVGSDSITASFVASTNDVASTSSSVTVTVSAPTTPPTPSYTMAATPASLSIAQGQTGTTTLTFTPSGGYSGKLTLSCIGLPLNTSCAFTQGGTANNIVTMSGNNQPITVALAVQTNVATAQMQALPSSFGPGYSPANPSSPLSPILPALAFWWPGSMAGLSAFGRKRGRSKTQQRMLQLCLLVLMTGALAAGISGCGGSAASTPAAASVTPAGSSTTTVLATPTPSSGQSIQGLSLTLTIT